jgi:hypothetical protein
MLYFAFLLLLFFNFSLEDILYTDFPLNSEFNILNEETGKDISNIYVGNIMTYFKIKTKNKTLTSYLKNVDNIRFDFIYLNMTDFKGENLIIQCSECSSNDEECKGTCIDKLAVGYGDFILIRYIHLPFLLVFFGTFMIFFGRNHYLFGMFFEFVGFLYYFIINLIELFSAFDNNAIPFYILGASLISGFISIFFGYEGNKKLVLFDIFKIVLGVIIGYFFIKTLFYYISIFAPINNILYLILLLLFVIVGGLAQFFLKNKFKTDQLLFIVASTLIGSTFIVRGIGFIVGGYFSDTMTAQFGLKFEYDAKMRVTYFLVLHVILLAVSLFYQIKDYKDSVYEDSLSRQNSANVSNYSSQNKGMTMSKDINSVDSDTDSQVKAMNLKESLPESNKTGEVNLNENDENGDINDQDE